MKERERDIAESERKTAIQKRKSVDRSRGRLGLGRERALQVSSYEAMADGRPREAEGR